MATRTGGLISSDLIVSSEKIMTKRVKNLFIAFQEYPRPEMIINHRLRKQCWPGASRHCHRSADIPVRSAVRRFTRFGKQSDPTCIRGLLRTGMSALRCGGGFEMRRRWPRALTAARGEGQRMFD